MVRAASPLLCLGALFACACKTGQPKDDSVIFVGAAPPVVAAETEPAPAATAAPEHRPSLLDEPLRPVRGGSRALPPYRGPEP